MTKSEAIHRAALRKHRHKGNYIATHEALLAESEYLQQRDEQKMLRRRLAWAVAGPVFMFIFISSAALLAQIIKGWFS